MQGQLKVQIKNRARAQYQLKVQTVHADICANTGLKEQTVHAKPARSKLLMAPTIYKCANLETHAVPILKLQIVNNCAS